MTLTNRTTNPPPEPTFAGLTLRCYRWARQWRYQVAVSTAIGVARWQAARAVGVDTATALFVVLVLVVVAVPPLRNIVNRWLIGSARRRRWETLLGFLWPAPTTPVVRSCGISPVGVWAEVRVGPGGTIGDIASQGEAIASWLDALETRVTAHPTTTAIATIHALRVDPLARPASPWPGIHLERTSLWWPVPVGIDENGNPVTVTLPEHNLLLGGEPGAGKSVALSQLVAAAALDPDSRLWLLDGKLVELAAWRQVAAGTAGIPIGDAIDLLHHIQTVMNARYQQLLETGLRKIPEGSGLEVVVVDELAHYATWPDKKQRDTFTDLLRDLVARGRAAGVIVLAATQKPSADVIPTSLRDLFGYRWALRCTTPAASDTILGGGWATNNITASTIAPAARGVGWLLHESGVPVRLRAHHLNDHTINLLARRATRLRSSPGRTS